MARLTSRRRPHWYSAVEAARSGTYRSPRSLRRPPLVRRRSPSPEAVVMVTLSSDEDREGRRIPTQSATPIRGRNVHLDTEWTHGDLALTTSDGWRFCVPRHYLLSARFRRMYEDASGGQGFWPYDHIPDADVFRAFMALAAGRPLTLTPRLRIERRLARYLVEYECDGLLRTLLMTIRDTLARDPRALSPIHAWILAASINDPATAAAALDAPRSTWAPATFGLLTTPLPTLEALSYDLRRGVPGQSVFNPAAWPLAFFTHVPPRYACALARAYGRVQRCGGRLSTAFLRFLEE